MKSLPLSDVQVIELGEFVSGPYCTKLLAEFGAEVIKVESPHGGDVARRWGPFLKGFPHHEQSALFLYLNTSKKSITLDWNTKTGYGILERLTAEADILIENIGSNSIGSLALHELNPRLISISISYFGENGPYRNLRGADIIAQALSGVMALTGLPDRGPLKIAGPQAEYQAGLEAAVAAAAALWERDQTGQGAHLDVSVIEALAAILEGTLTGYAYDGTVRQRDGSRHPSTYPSTILPCKDGYVHVDSSADPEILAAFTGIPELAECAIANPREKADEIDALLVPWLAEREAEELFHSAQEWRLPFAPVLGIGEQIDDPHLRERGFFAQVEHPEAGDFIIPADPFVLDGDRVSIRRPPLLGEHNVEIYCNRLGLSREELGRLRGLGVI